jgi:hypothetical protein
MNTVGKRMLTVTKSVAVKPLYAVPSARCDMTILNGAALSSGGEEEYVLAVRVVPVLQHGEPLEASYNASRYGIIGYR